MGHFVPALNGPCSCPPMGHDLGPNLARYNGTCRPDTKLFRAVPCLGRAFFPCFGPAHQARPKCTPIVMMLIPMKFMFNILLVMILFFLMLLSKLLVMMLMFHIKERTLLVMIVASNVILELLIQKVCSKIDALCYTNI
jgi:hypothetical protein